MQLEQRQKLNDATPTKLVLGVWLILSVVGFAFAVAYESRPGISALAGPSWPQGSQLERGNGFTLVVFAHPHCPCSRATMDELGKVVSHAENLTTYVLFEKLPGFDEDFVKSDLWQTASGIPNVSTKYDERGREAALFGASTSGDALLYNARGKLVFEGGITSARGHAGDNTGSLSIVSLTKGKIGLACRTPVYGCSLIDQEQQP